MNTNPIHLLKLAESKTKLFWNGLGKLYPKLSSTAYPILRLNSKLYRTAGRCFQEDGIIELGTRFLNHSEAYRYELLNSTLPHELIHLADYRIFGPCEFQHGHGKGWRRLMVECGLEPNPYHEMIDLQRKA